MKLKQLFAKWSRKIHRWIGLYFALVVMIYTIEAFSLTAVFGAGLPTVDGSPPTSAFAIADLLSIDRAVQIFQERHPQGVDSWDEIDEIAYLPQAGVYRFANTKRYFEWYLDASSGELLKYGFKAAPFLEEKSLFGWWHPWIHDFVEFPMLLLLFSLAVSGVYLFVLPFFSKRNSETDSMLKDTNELTEVQ
ncbi:MAG: hypothetical protein QNJ72_11535 [Pleurocapsa sp. MO_226.B13]|nr:hypothetical protein [Pleurocapsa sp. MO_226.B13]